MTSAQPGNTKPTPATTTTVEGGTDFTKIKPGDLVAHGRVGGRKVLLEAGVALTSGREPVATAPDGGVERLDGNFVTKLDGEVVDVSVSNDNLRK